jgi:hypothetical protein
MYVAEEYRKTQAELDELLEKMQDEYELTPEVLLMIDYVYHNEDDNYEGGLSFLDRLHKKLSLYFSINWDVTNIKNMIRQSEHPEAAFIYILNELLNPEMISCYGV